MDVKYIIKTTARINFNLLINWLASKKYVKKTLTSQ